MPHVSIRPDRIAADGSQDRLAMKTVASRRPLNCSSNSDGVTMINEFRLWLTSVVLDFLKLLRLSMGGDHTLQKIAWQIERRLRGSGDNSS